MQSRKNFSIIDTNFLFLIIALLLLSIGTWVQERQIYMGLIITEYLLILFPVILYLKVKRHNLKEFLRINSLSFKQILYIVLIVILSYPIAVFFNYLGILLLSKFGRIMPNPIPIPSDINEFLFEFFIVALTPGLCEEIMFRGMIMKSYEVYDRKKAIVLSAVLFGIFHFNFQNLLGPIFLGILFGILVSKTKSLFSSIIGHTINNTIALIIGFFSGHIQQTSEEMVLDTGMMVYGVVILGIIALLFWIIVRKLINSMPSHTNRFELIGEITETASIIRRKMSPIELIPIFIVVIIYIVLNYNVFIA